PDQVDRCERDQRADEHLEREQAEEHGRLAEAPRHGSLDADRLGDRVGRRQRHHRGGERRRAEQADREEQLCAAPATGRSASAACFALDSGPCPPIAAAVAMMMHIAMKSPNTAPPTASTRSSEYSSAVMPRSTTPAAV